jgi:hypothetical protein
VTACAFGCTLLFGWVAPELGWIKISVFLLALSLMWFGAYRNADHE